MKDVVFSAEWALVVTFSGRMFIREGAERLVEAQTGKPVFEPNNFRCYAGFILKFNDE